MTIAVAKVVVGEDVRGRHRNYSYARELAGRKLGKQAQIANPRQLGVCCMFKAAGG